MARILLAAVGLWMVLSRHDLPSILAFPPELWRNVTPERRLRFAMVLPLGLERALYWTLHGTLLCALLGVRARAACFASGLLLYHFAPFETIIRTANPYLRGFTLPCLGLLVVSFARCADALTLERALRRAPVPPDAPEYRWPVALVQVLFCQIYFFAGWSKLATTGWAWLEAGNIRGHLLVLNQALTADPASSWGYALARHPALCVAAGLDRHRLRAGLPAGAVLGAGAPRAAAAGARLPRGQLGAVPHLLPERLAAAAVRALVARAGRQQALLARQRASAAATAAC